MLKLNML